jgi:hypothetical protein
MPLSMQSGALVAPPEKPQVTSASGRRRFLLAVTSALLHAGACGWSAEEPGTSPAPRTPPQVEAVCVSQPPTIDGQLDDACWAEAPRLTGFFSPDVNEPVPEETIGMVCADGKAIYVAFICRDRTPGDIMSAETHRNGAIWDDDFVEVGLDPWNQHGDMYAFRVTANGTQSEDIPGGSATKIEWRGDWKGAATRTPDGWTAELAIPYSILRYPLGQTTFGLYIGRHFGAERIWVMHPVTGTGKGWDKTLACDLCGLHPPVQKPRPIYMPYVMADLGDSPGRHFDTGLDLQYRMENGLTALATLNPDFTQIEQAVEPISFSYTERYLPELRPFFVTGQGYLPGDVMLYTPRIGDFDAGLKLFGTLGADRYGFLDAIRYGLENTLAAQTTHKFSDTYDMTVRFVDHREVGEPGNIVWAFAGGRNLRSNDGQDAQWVMFRQSRWQNGASGATYNLGVSHSRGTDRLHYFGLLQLATDYQPALGYFWDQNSTGGIGDLGIDHHNDKGKVEAHGWGVFWQYMPYLHGGGMLHSRISPGYYLKLRRGYVFSADVAPGRDYNDNTSDAGLYFGWNDNDMYRRGGFSIRKGKRAGGDYIDLSIGQGAHPARALSVNANVAYSHLSPPSPDAYHAYQAVLTASYDVTPERTLSARAIAQDGGVTAYAAYRQVVRRGTDIYIILGDPDPSHTGVANRLAVKFIRVL